MIAVQRGSRREKQQISRRETRGRNLRQLYRRLFSLIRSIMRYPLNEILLRNINRFNAPLPLPSLSPPFLIPASCGYTHGWDRSSPILLLGTGSEENGAGTCMLSYRIAIG
jgi:hypothetical protein